MAMVLPLLFSQFFFAKFVSEPYPSFIFPSFAKPKSRQHFEYQKPKCFAIGLSEVSQEIDINDLLFDMPVFLRTRQLRNKFYSDSSFVIPEKTRSELEYFLKTRLSNLDTFTEIIGFKVEWYVVTNKNGSLKETFDRIFYLPFESTAQ